MKKIHGLFLDPRTWKIDFQSSCYWNPEKYGINIDLHNNAFNIPKTGVDKKYKFVLTTEVWEIPIRKTLEYLRNYGLKVFLVAREPIKYGELVNAMFNYERFKFNGGYYFKPDAVLAAGRAYADLWKDKTKVYVTGYPRWDWYVNAKQIPTKSEVIKKYNLENRKIIFFSSYPPYHYKKENNKDIMLDLYDARESTLRVLEKFAKSNSDYQVVVKIHPMSMKCYLKKTGKGNEVSGLLEKYYKNPKSYFKVIGDDRMNGNVSRELLSCADLVIGYNSTMLLEASLLSKPVIHVLLGNSATIISPYEGSFRSVFSENEFLKVLQSFHKGESFGSNRGFSLSKHYFNDVDGLACKRMCEAIRELI